MHGIKRLGKPPYHSLLRCLLMSLLSIFTLKLHGFFLLPNRIDCSINFVKPLFCHLTPDLFAPTQSQIAISAQEPVKISKAEKALQTVKKTALRRQKKTQQRVTERPQME